MDLIEKIAPACAWVAEQARHVKINHEKIPEYTAFILGKYPLITNMDTSCHYVSDDKEDTARYVIALDSINFGSGYFYPGFDYANVAEGLKRSFERKEFNSPERWTGITAKDFSDMMGIHEKLDELFSLFAEHLRTTGEIMLDRYQGRALNLIEETGRSAARLADTVAAWTGFHDVHAYKGREIPLLKRAQILAADMDLSLSGFTDMDKLTIFADNMVPHVLRCDGIVEYDSDEIIPSGSEKEIEIRACAIHIVELMKRMPAVTSVNLDHLLWNRGYEPELLAASQKPHRTLSVFY